MPSTTTTPAEMFSTMTEGLATAVKAGFDAQTQFMNTWTRAFGTNSPMMGMMGDMDAQVRAATITTAEIARKNAGEVAEFMTDNVQAAAEMFGHVVETTFGAEAPTSVEEALETTQGLTQNAMEMMRTAAERATKMAARQVESFQSVTAQAGGSPSKAGRRTAKTSGK